MATRRKPNAAKAVSPSRFFRRQTRAKFFSSTGDSRVHRRLAAVRSELPVVGEFGTRINASVNWRPSDGRSRVPRLRSATAPHRRNQRDPVSGRRTVVASATDSTLAREKNAGKYSPAAQGL